MPALASFDIFDTLICRGVEHPVDIFRIMEISHPDKVPTGFAELRERSERKSRRLTSREDVTLDHIYEVLSKELSGEFTASVIKDIEVETELLFSLPRKDGIARFNKLRGEGYRVIGISDMYLSKPVIAAMLAKNGVVLDELYVSSELGVTKATGNMYRQVAVLEDQPLSWTHHGDNYRSDVANAIALGLRAIHTPITDFPLYHKGNSPVGMTEGVVTALVRQLMYGRDGDISERTWFQIGAQHTGPLSILLCHLVRQTADRTGARNIFFLARDGYVLKRVYEILFPGDTRNLSYLAASRRMINFPLAVDDEASIFKFVASDAVGMTGRNLLARVQVSVRDGDPETDTILKTDAQVKKFLTPYIPAIMDQARHEGTHVEAYLEHEGLLSNDDSVIVDVGWLCSMQKNLTRLLSNRGFKGSIHGVYFGTNNNPKPNLNIEGLFYTGLSATSAVKAIASHVEVMELLFASAEQSIVTVAPNNAGGFDFVRLGNDSEATRIKAATKIVDGAVEFAEHAKRLGLDALLASPEGKKASLSAFKKLCRNPGMEVAACASSINHSVGFGGSLHSSLAPAGFDRNIKRLILDYTQSHWRGAVRQMAKPYERLVLLPFNETIYRWAWYLLWRMPKPIKLALKSIVGRVLNALKAA